MLKNGIKIYFQLKVMAYYLAAVKMLIILQDFMLRDKQRPCK